MGLLKSLVNFGLQMVEERLDDIARTTGRASRRIEAGNFPQTPGNLAKAGDMKAQLDRKHVEAAAMSEKLRRRREKASNEYSAD